MLKLKIRFKCTEQTNVVKRIHLKCMTILHPTFILNLSLRKLIMKIFYCSKILSVVVIKSRMKQL